MRVFRNGTRISVDFFTTRRSGYPIKSGSGSGIPELPEIAQQAENDRKLELSREGERRSAVGSLPRRDLGPRRLLGKLELGRDVSSSTRPLHASGIGSERVATCRTTARLGKIRGVPAWRCSRTGGWATADKRGWARRHDGVCADGEVDWRLGEWSRGDTGSHSRDEKLGFGVDIGLGLARFLLGYHSVRAIRVNRVPWPQTRISRI